MNTPNPTAENAADQFCTGTWNVIFGARLARNPEGRATVIAANAPHALGDGWYSTNIALMEGRTTLADAEKIISTTYGNRFDRICPRVAVNTETGEKVYL